MFLFLLNLNFIASGVGVIVTSSLHYTTTFLNLPLYADLYLIKSGSGKNTTLYRDLCLPLLEQRDALLDEYEINKYTGQYDGPGGKMPIFISEKEIVQREILEWPKVMAREAKLTYGERAKLAALRADEQAKLSSAIAEQQSFPSDYPILTFMVIASNILQLVVICGEWLFIGKLYFSFRPATGKKYRIILRLGAAMLAGMAINMLLAASFTNFTFHPKIGLSEQSELLQREYENHGWACGGHFDPKGLW